MKTKILSLAMGVAIALAGFNGSAQNDQQKRGPKKAHKECVETSKESKERKCIKAECTSAERPGGRQDRFLEGITLTPEQQAKVDAMKQKNKADFDKKQKERQQKLEKQAEKQRKKDQSKMQKRLEKLDKEMKEILTPEQYQIFKNNLNKAKAERKNHKEGLKKGHHDSKGHKDAKKGHKGHCAPDCKKKGGEKAAEQK